MTAPTTARAFALLALCVATSSAWADERLSLTAAPPALSGAGHVQIVVADPDIEAAVRASPDALRAVVGAGSTRVTAVRALGAEPVHTVLAFDQSGSFKAHWKDAFALARAYADAVPAGVTTEVVTFGVALNDQGRATDKAALDGVLQKAESQGAIQGLTRLRNFIREAVARAEAGAPLGGSASQTGLRQVVVFTDAGEESTAYSVQDVIDQARGLGVIIHVVAWTPGGGASGAARKLDEVKQMAEGTGGRFVQVDDLAKARQTLGAVATLGQRAFWVDLAWCGVPTDRGDRFDDKVEIEAWRGTTRAATTGPRPFRQHAVAPATAPCGPAPTVDAQPPAPDKPAAKGWPWWWWIPLAALALLGLPLLFLLLRRRPAEQAPAPPPPPAPPAPPPPAPLPPPPPPAGGTSDPFAPVKADADPLERLPELHLELVNGPPGAKARIRLHQRVMVVGAGPEADLRLDVAQVSGRHARIQLYPNGNVYVIDEGSTNGTFLGDRRLAKEERVKVELGQTVAFSRQLTYRLARPAPAEKAEAPAPPPPVPPPAPPVEPPRPKSRTIIAPVTPPASAGPTPPLPAAPPARPAPSPAAETAPLPPTDDPLDAPPRPPGKP